MKRLKEKIGISLLLYGIVFILACFFLVGIMIKEQVKADTYQDYMGNAENFYDTYGDRKMVFFPLDEIDGNIYFASRGKTAAASAGTKFREIGWQFVFTNTRTKETGVIYYQRGGKYIREPLDLKVTSSDGYTYTMYYIKLSQLMKRLSSNWESAFNAGEVELAVNSVMTIVVDGDIKGSMDDYGNFEGKVYTTYDGIAGAAGWSSGAKDSLHSYFGKTIDGLFHTVKIINGAGIESTSGAGTYLYGTKITIKSTPQVGYQWNADRNSKWVSTDSTFSSKRQNAFYTVGSKDVTLVVQASKNQYTIRYQDGGTVSSTKLVVNYGDTVTLPTLAGSGLSLGENYTYDSNKTWAVVRKSDNAIYASGWKTGWQNGGIAQSAWSKYKEGFSFPVNTVWINATGNPHGDDTFYFYLQKEKKPIPSVTVVFHKNYAGQTDETYTETYYEGVANQTFGMKLSSDAAGWVYWNKSPDGYYLPGDGSHGGGWSEDENDTAGDYGLCDKVQDAWIRQMNGNTIHLYMIRPPKKLVVVFHKNYAGQTDETYSETYTYGVANQSFGMDLSSDAAGWVYWNKSPEGYYLPGDTDNGGGWAKDKNSYTRNYTLSSSVSNTFILQHADKGTLHLYMVRSPKKIQVIFHKNDGTAETYDETYTYGVANQYFGMNLSAADAYFLNWKRSGYSGILGWARTSTATTKNYNTSDKVADSWIVANEPKIDLYAVWGSVIQITVNPNGGTWEGSENVQQFTKQKGEILSLPYPTRTGYTFVGWTWNGGTGESTRSSINGWTQTEEAQTGNKAAVSYNSSETYTSYTYNVASTVETDAWNRLTVGNYTITAGHTYRISGRIRINEDAPVGVMIYHGEKSNDYMNSKGTLYGSSDWQEFSYERTFDTAGTGYFELVSTNFKGKSGTLKIDLENLMVLDVTANTYMVLDQINSPMNNATNLAVTAHWQGNEVGYEVYHNQMNVSGEGYTLWKTESKTGIAGSTLTVADVVLSPTGFTKPDTMTVDNQSVTSTTIQGDGSTKIYLYYDRNQYELTLKAGTGILETTINETTAQTSIENGVMAQTAKIYYGAEITAKAEVKTGYAWDEKAGWSGTYTSSEQNYAFTMPAKNVTLTAEASIIHYNITYHLDGGSVSGNPTTYTVEDSFALNNPEKIGNRFCGWTGSNGETLQSLVTVTKGTIGDLEFYANWELLEFYLNVNGFLNGTDYEQDFVERLYDTQRDKTIAVFDVSIKKPGEDWVKAASKVTDYSKLLPYGTQWKLENIAAQNYGDWYYAYEGVKSGVQGEKNGSLSGTIDAAVWENLVFTSWHRLMVGGYVNGSEVENVEGYGSFDIEILGNTALGTSITADGNDVTQWDEFYPKESIISISDIKINDRNISDERFANITYEGIYDSGIKNEESVTDNLGKVVTKDSFYKDMLIEEKAFWLKLNSWYKTLLDQQNVTKTGTKEIWHIFGKQAYYNEAGEHNRLEELSLPERFGFVFQGYYTEKDGKGDKYIDDQGNIVNDLHLQKKNQTLFAYWTSLPPVIQAFDSYFTLKEAQSGKITKQELLAMAEAIDPEEGKLQEGSHSGSVFDLENFDEEVFLKLEQGAAVSISYVAVDRAGNIGRCNAVVYVVDTAPQIIHPSGNEVRFISEKYLEEENIQGGLLKDSVWKKEEHYEILKDCQEN